MARWNSLKFISIVVSTVMLQPVLAQTQAVSPVTLPAGTRVMMVLKSPLHTTSAASGSGLYLQTLFPVIQDNRVVIPAHAMVQGVVEGDERPGHIRRKAEFAFHFTSLIFPDNSVVSIDGVLLGIPGASNIRVMKKDDKLQTIDQPEKAIAPALTGAVSGAIAGSVQRTGIGKGAGAGLGATLAAVFVLLKRGDDINLPTGTNVEMALRAPLLIDASLVDKNARYVPPSVPEIPDRIVPVVPLKPDPPKPRTMLFPGWFIP